jgi:hypothetical protein
LILILQSEIRRGLSDGNGHFVSSMFRVCCCPIGMTENREMTRAQRNRQ